MSGYNNSIKLQRGDEKDAVGMHCKLWGVGSWLVRKRCTKKELLLIAGQLQHASAARIDTPFQSCRNMCHHAKSDLAAWFKFR